MNDASLTGLEKLMRSLKAEPRKALFLAALVVVLLVGGLPRLLKGRSGPAPAAASISAPRVAAPTTNPSDLPAMALADWLKDRLPPVNRNLFQIKLYHFPQDGTDLSQLPREQPGNGFWDLLGKSLASKSDQDNKRRILIESLRAEAARELRLESTLISAGQTKAMIKGNLVAEGDVVSGFTIVKIEPQRVIVQREGIQLAVTIK